MQRSAFGGGWGRGGRRPCNLLAQKKKYRRIFLTTAKTHISAFEKEKEKKQEFLKLHAQLKMNGWHLKINKEIKNLEKVKIHLKLKDPINPLANEDDLHG